MNEPQDDPENRLLNRVDAAAYLATKGFPMVATTLAKHASTGSGPTFTLTGRHHNATYRQADLDAWATRGGASPPRGRPKNKQSDLSTAVTELLPMIDRAMHGQGTFSDGMRFAETVEKVRKALARLRRANGTD